MVSSVQHRTADSMVCFQLRNRRIDGASSIIPLIVDTGAEERAAAGTKAMTTLIAVFVAATVTTALCAVFIESRNLLRVFVSALAVALIARMMWFFGVYAVVIPDALERRVLVPMAAPMAAAILYGGWFIARARSSRAARKICSSSWLRRFAPLGVAALGAIAVVALSTAIQVGRGEWTASADSDAAVIPLVVMLVPSLLSYAKQRDAELAFLMAAAGLFATVPIVIGGRLSYLLIAQLAYDLVS